MKKIIIFLFFICFFMPGKSQADPFRFFGSRPAGMGGAYVAIAEGSLAQYWNPAGLALKQTTFDFRIPEVGAGVEITKDTLEKAEKISDLSNKIDTIQNKVSTSTMSMDDYNDFLEILDAVNGFRSDPGLGVVGTVYGGIDLKGWSFGLSVNSYTDFSAAPFIDFNNINLVNGVGAIPSGPVTSAPNSSLTASRDDLKGVLSDLDTRGVINLGSLSSEEAANAIINNSVSSGNSSQTIQDTINALKASHDKIKSSLPSSGSGDFKDNKTSLVLRGANITEISLGVGGHLPFYEETGFFSNFLVGGNIKVLQAKVGYARLNILDTNADLNDLVDNMQNNVKKSTTASVDFGLLYDKKNDWSMRFGMVFKNLTSPSFSAPADNPDTAAIEGEGGDFKMNAQIRAGVAYWLLNWWVVAIDIDVTENETVLPGYNSRLFSFGSEYKFFNSRELDIIVRVGMYNNIAESESALSYTLGLGFTLLNVNLDIAGAMSSETKKTGSGSTIPSSTNITAALSVLF